jgi:hypothetical protein
MKLKSLAAATCALALAAPPALAAPANPASSLSVSRAATPAKKSSGLAQPGALVGIILAAAVVAGGIIIAVDDNDDSDSN